MKGSEKRPNLGTKQPGIEYPKPGQGWPSDLKDQSSPITHKYTVGKSGETIGKSVLNVQSTTTPTDKA